MERLEHLEVAHALSVATKNVIEGIDKKLIEANGNTRVYVRTEALESIKLTLSLHNELLQKFTEHEEQINDKLESLLAKFPLTES